MLSRISVILMRQSRTRLIRSGRSVSKVSLAQLVQVQKHTTLQTPDQDPNVVLWVRVLTQDP